MMVYYRTYVLFTQELYWGKRYLILGQMSFQLNQKSFFLKAIGPVNGMVEQYQEFLAKAKDANRIEILMSWHGAQVHSTITFPPSFKQQ